jgi:hypothetical protein
LTGFGVSSASGTDSILVLFNEDGNVLLAGFGYAAHHPARGQFLQGMIAVRDLISPATRSYL